MKAKNENQVNAGEKGRAVRIKNGPAKAREVWDKPVSKSFYEKLRVKVSDIVKSLGYVRGYTDEIMKSIDRYMANGEVPVRYYCEEYFMAIFFTLRIEVDEAMARSAAARQRAAQRRARKEAERKEAGNNKKIMITPVASGIKGIESPDYGMNTVYPESGEEPDEMTMTTIKETCSGKLSKASPVDVSSVESMFRSIGL